MGCSASRPATVANKALDGCAAYFFPTRSRPLRSGAAGSSLVAVSVPKTRSLPSPVVHHPPNRAGDSHHLVSLISTTYGSLILIDHQPSSPTSANGEDLVNQTYSPDSVINAWELMEGLDDIDEGEIREDSSSKPLWKHLSEESLVPRLESNSPSTFKRASSSTNLGIARARSSNRSVDSTPIVSRLSSLKSSPQFSTSSSNNPVRVHVPEDRIVVYYTSLRTIRKTYSDCCAVRTIFRAQQVYVDERDVSMDSRYRDELMCALGSGSLPQVFISGRHIGGVEQIKQLNEDGELMKLIHGFPVSIASGFVCRSCGDARFIPCCDCHGSRRVFGKEGWRTRCSICNENGLIRCPACCF